MRRATAPPTVAVHAALIEALARGDADAEELRAHVAAHSNGQLLLDPAQLDDALRAMIRGGLVERRAPAGPVHGSDGRYALTALGWALVRMSVPSARDWT
jgi:hypothetical protein